MATPTFTYAPEIDWVIAPTMPVAVFRYAGQATEQRASLLDVQRDAFEWPMKQDASGVSAINEFFRLRGQTRDTFYVRPPKSALRTSVSLGTATSGQTGFVLPTSGDNKRDYPIGSTTFTVYDDGVAVSSTVTVSDDARRFTLAVAPASGSVMTCDYRTWRLVRLEEPFEWTGLAPNWFEARPRFVEVPG